MRTHIKRRRRARPSLRSSRGTPGGAIAPSPAAPERLAADRAGARQSAHRGRGTERRAPLGGLQKESLQLDRVMAYYYNHPDLVLPEDASVIWRYMELCKFQSMLQWNSIFFSRADKQTDKLEGEYPEGMVAELERRFGNGILTSNARTPCTFHEWHTQKEIPSRLISCWSMGPSESRRMWTEYTHCKESIAICSTIERLKNCFHDKVEPVVWIGSVRYGEEENRLPSSSSQWNVNFWLYPFFAKKEAFRWENEIRGIVNIARRKQAQLGHSQNGCYVKADLQILIESVWIHPQSRAGFRDQVGAVLGTYGFGNVEIYQSPWDSLP